MKIILNNREMEIENSDRINISELLEIKRFTFPHIIVKINGKLVKKEEYNETYIMNGDKVDAIHLIGGG